MRRHRNLYEKIISFQNLLLASKLAQRGKRFKSSTARFNFYLERELWKLQEELVEKRYEPGDYRHFTILWNQSLIQPSFTIPMRRANTREPMPQSTAFRNLLKSTLTS